jgi:hypothetical protein
MLVPKEIVLFYTRVIAAIDLLSFGVAFNLSFLVTML